MIEFKDIGLKPELVESLRRIGFIKTTEVQERTIPTVLKRKDVIVRAKTGTGKTGAFLVPIMQSISPSRDPCALIIVPTRELALQISTVAGRLGTPLRFNVATVYGGASMNVQIRAIENGASIIVGTPGRVIDLIERGALRLDRVRFVVLDEADTMLDMGFIDDIEYILSMTPMTRQTLLFSATMPKQIVDIAKRHMNQDYENISVGKEEELTVDTITHTYFFAKGRMKFAAMLAYIKQYSPKKAIIFSRTKNAADIIHMVLVKEGYDAILMHGGLTQARREKSLDRFRKGARFLISTNVAARGLDIDNVTDIINFDAPESPYNYVHRVGRSARMGKEGRAFTLFGYDEKDLVRAIEYEANVRMSQINLDIAKYQNAEVLNHLGEGRIRAREGGGYIGRRPHGSFRGDRRSGWESRERGGDVGGFRHRRRSGYKR